MTDDFYIPKSIEGSFTCKASDDIIDYFTKKPDKKQVIKNTEALMKEYNIKKENMIADYETLRWLFLEGDE